MATVTPRESPRARRPRRAKAEPTVAAGPAWRAWAPVLVLGAAVLVGLNAPYQHLKATRSPFTFDVASKADEVFAAARPHVRAGERLGILVSGRNDTADMTQWYAAQYALVPAVVLPLYVEDCLKAVGGPRCRVADADRVLIQKNPQVLELVRARLGLVPTSAAGNLVFVARGAR